MLYEVITVTTRFATHVGFVLFRYQKELDWQQPEILATVVTTRFATHVGFVS